MRSRQPAELWVASLMVSLERLASRIVQLETALSDEREAAATAATIVSGGVKMISVRFLRAKVRRFIACFDAKVGKACKSC